MMQCSLISTVAAVLTLCGSLSLDKSRRYAGVLTAGVAFLAAYMTHPEALAVPTLGWHWLPYLFVAGAIVGPISYAEGVSRLERAALRFLLVMLAAILIAPNLRYEATDSIGTLLGERARIEAALRQLSMAGVAVGLFLPCTLLESLAQRRSAHQLLCGVGASCLTAAVVLAAAGAEQLAQLTLGLAIGVVVWGAGSAWRGGQLNPGALSVCYLVLAAILVLARRQSIDPIPWAATLLILAAPLVGWLFEWPPVKRRTASVASRGYLATAVTLLALAVVIAA